jgi:undecaprenyl-diphosphatase
MLDGFTDDVIEWADGFGLLGLALVSFTEAAFQPVPPDLLVIPMSIEASGTSELLLIFLVATLSSVLGSLGGYAIGVFGGRPVLEKFAKPEISRKLDELTRRYGDVGVFVAAVSPIPYKALAWTAGAGRMNIRTFLIAGLFGRSIRFGLEVAVLGFWGGEFTRMLENPIFWIVAGLLSIAIFFPLSSWWKSLDPPIEHPDQ